MNSCKHEPEIMVEYDTGSLQKKDEWKLCKSCSQLPQFQKYRISEVKIGDLEK